MKQKLFQMSSRAIHFFYLNNWQKNIFKYSFIFKDIVVFHLYTINFFMSVKYRMPLEFGPIFN